MGAPRRPAARRAAPPSPSAWPVCCDSPLWLPTALLSGRWWGCGSRASPAATGGSARLAQRRRQLVERRRAADPPSPAAGSPGTLGARGGRCTALIWRRAPPPSCPPIRAPPPLPPSARGMVGALSFSFFLCPIAFLLDTGGSCLCVWWSERLGPPMRGDRWGGGVGGQRPVFVALCGWRSTIALPRPPACQSGWKGYCIGGQSPAESRDVLCEGGGPGIGL